MADAAIKVTEEARDRLRVLAELPTDAERAERTARGLTYVRTNLCPDLTDDDVRRAQEWRADIAAGRVGDRR
ncbi:hypothetical protein ACX6XY_25335 [Streptomyces sp. O3]